MIKWIKKKIKDWIGMTQLEKEHAELHNRVTSHKKFVNRKMAELKEYTRVDADVGHRSNNTIILTGVYKRKAYVQFYDCGDGEFNALVEQLRDMRTHALIRHIDAPPNFRGTFNL